jgi:hypothetical protein
MNIASLIQAARGPILLITIGALMAIDYNTAFGFSHTWPVLIIVFGVLKLLERMATPPPPVYAPSGFQPGQNPNMPAPPGSVSGPNVPGGMAQ